MSLVSQTPVPLRQTSAHPHDMHKTAKTWQPEASTAPGAAASVVQHGASPAVPCLQLKAFGLVEGPDGGAAGPAAWAQPHTCCQPP